MSKLHSKNGFEYKCNRSYYGGWYIDWYFRPAGEEIFIPYACEKEKTVKKDLEALLSSLAEATEYYFNKLKRMSDISAAEKDLKEAEAHYSRVYSPDFDLRGNNPNREVRARKDAELRLASAKCRLQTAMEFTGILQKKQSGNG